MLVISRLLSQTSCMSILRYRFLLLYTCSLFDEATMATWLQSISPITFGKPAMAQKSCFTFCRSELEFGKWMYVFKCFSIVSINCEKHLKTEDWLIPIASLDTLWNDPVARKDKALVTLFITDRACRQSATMQVSIQEIAYLQNCCLVEPKSLNAFFIGQTHNLQSEAVYSLMDLSASPPLSPPSFSKQVITRIYRRTHFSPLCNRNVNKVEHCVFILCPTINCCNWNERMASFSC